ncbi:hypothetical protein AB3Y40_04170 [Yoonia sp. R2331]|uniref:hypothetical protein n=1 Tax=Yoonia sp. R2331 TaxID=3237238 RepID=UPI0034E42213
MKQFLWMIVTIVPACTPFPALDSRISADAARADYPALVPLGPVLDAAATAGTAPQDAGLDARIAALNARAAALRGAVVDPATRAQMQSGVTRAPLR